MIEFHGNLDGCIIINIYNRYYINPGSYSHKILGVNEFLSGDYENGEEYLRQLSFPESKDNLWFWFLMLILFHFICMNYIIFSCNINNNCIRIN